MVRSAILGRTHFTLFFAIIYFFGQAQVLSIEPPFPTQLDSITVFFDATQGNGTLTGFTEAVYAHTGVITSQSVNGNDWKHVIGNWGTADARTLMTRVSENIYSLSFRIENFYGILPGETVLKLAFVFRNVDGSIVGRDSDGSDIFHTIYPPGEGLFFTLLSPERPGTIIQENDSLFIRIRISDTASISITDNDEIIFSDTLNEVSFFHHVAELGLHELIFNASTDTTVSLTTTYFVLGASQNTEDPPAGLVNGLNYYTDSTYIFQLFAPLKKFVFYFVRQIIIWLLKNFK
ncbi:MAG: hypothetical protein IPL46_14220 [Saprospiraceae bacterium]|nr:hypothetical protein [Saprospiraceae bacterium]